MRLTLVCAKRSPFEADTGDGSKAPYNMYLPDLRSDFITLGDMAPPMASIAPYAILPPANIINNNVLQVFQLIMTLDTYYVCPDLVLLPANMVLAIRRKLYTI